MRFSDFLKEHFYSRNEVLEEMPQYHPSVTGTMPYQRASKFAPVSINNVKSYTVLGEGNDFVFLLHPSGSHGYVFRDEDYNTTKNVDIVPVMTLMLRDVKFSAFKQAYRLRIKESHSRLGLATSWYLLYVNHVGGIVSDNDHLEGGKKLWRSLIDKGSQRGLNITLYDINTRKSQTIDKNISDETLWSLDQSKKNLVIIMSK